MNRSSMVFFGLLVALLVGLSASASAWTKGDVFAGVGGGQIKVFDQTGALKQTLTTGDYSSNTTGIAFDAGGNLYSTRFDDNRVAKFDPSGTFLGYFGAGYNSSVESIVRDASGNMYAGHADGARDILKFDVATGTLQATYDVATTNRGSDWIDLAADQTTMYYTSEGHEIKRFDVSTNTQLTDFASGMAGGEAYAFRILADGGVLVATTNQVQRLDVSGTQVQVYDVAGANFFFAMNLDPDGTSFWSGDLDDGDVYKFDIATGNVLASFNTGISTALGGLAVFGERTQGGGVNPVILVHGWTSDPGAWSSMTDHLHESGFKHVWSVDLDACATLEESKFDAIYDNKDNGRHPEWMFRGNAKKLSDYIESQLNSLPEGERSQIDHINIIGHSMGGLVARRYLNPIVRWDDWIPEPVSTLIMIATPNNGSPWGGTMPASRKQEGASHDDCGETKQRVAWRELGTGQMKDFNAYYGYDFGGNVEQVFTIEGWGHQCGGKMCFGCYWGLPNMKMKSPHDGVVEASSVRGRHIIDGQVSYAYNQNYNILECHTELPAHPDVLSVVDQMLSGEYIPEVRRRSFEDDSIGVAVGYSSSGAVYGVAALADSFFVERQGDLMVYAAISDSNYHLILRSPAGMRLDSLSALTDSAIVYNADSAGPEAFIVRQAASGRWHWALESSATPADSVYYEVDAAWDNGIAVGLSQTDDFLNSSDTLLMKVSVADNGSAVQGLRVLGLPTWNGIDSGKAIDFRDDGQQFDQSADDGTYTLGLTSLAQGSLHVNVTVDGLYLGGQLKRVASFSASIRDSSCCSGTTGNVDCDPAEIMDISDLSRLIDYMFISLEPLCCQESGNTDGSTDEIIDISDLSRLIDCMLISFTPPAACQ